MIFKIFHSMGKAGAEMLARISVQKLDVDFMWEFLFVDSPENSSAGSPAEGGPVRWREQSSKEVANTVNRLFGYLDELGGWLEEGLPYTDHLIIHSIIELSEAIIWKLFDALRDRRSNKIALAGEWNQEDTARLFQGPGDGEGQRVNSSKKGPSGEVWDAPEDQLQAFHDGFFTCFTNMLKDKYSERLVAKTGWEVGTFCLASCVPV